MRRVVLAALALVGLIPSGLAAQPAIRFAGVLRELCSDADGSSHPKKLTLEHRVVAEELAGEERPRLFLLYEVSGASPGRGKAIAKIDHLPAAGGRRGLGKLIAHQNRVDGNTAANKVVAATLEPGDTLRWRFTFKKLGRLDAGACFQVAGVVNPPTESCGPYPGWRSSEYILPYRPGTASVISQGNCDTGSHQRVAKHSYDFALPVGTELLAVRSGEVVEIDDVHPEGTGLVEHDNILMIQHDDGTFSRYVHIAQNGALVDVGDQVEQGQPVALSGNAGSTSGLPHLHFQAQSCPNRSVCGTLPVTFRNTKANPEGLLLGQLYKARAN